MSFAYGNPPRGNEGCESRNNDPNNYGTQNQGQGNSPGSQPRFEDSGVSRREGAWDDNATPGTQRTAGHGDSLGNTGYQGNTTDNNVPGAGAGNWQQGNPGPQDGNQGSGKPPMGQRVKGTAEKMTGKVTGSSGMQQRGEQRRENW
ncbi:hypothetical protein DAEQUDRAFT_754281 [Daedalea quercina L-15889]|uniref:Uncharacterized protein n=1 Tax=Daedalea quercina L-15889 TaxID=1314783 RepID=A0A165TSP1_9APHY|nr:hypothetical protein DAEQUDRAFT_754281 [Daedalea quercina L-15889]